MPKKILESCQSGEDFVKFCAWKKNQGQQEIEIRNGKGSHVVVSTDRGGCVIPVHNGDLGKGIRCKIMKTLAAILIIFVILIMLSCML